MFSVRWTHTALVSLGGMWVDADDFERSEIYAALEEINDDLTHRPLTVGESRAGNERVVFAPPLGLMYHVILDDRVVEVGRVWRVDP